METRPQRRRRSGLATGALVAALSALLLAPAPVEGGWVWTPETGWYNPSRRVIATPEELLAEARKAAEARALEDAVTGYELFLEAYPEDERRLTVLLELLEAQFELRRFPDALRTIDDIVAQSPDAETLAQVIRRKYEIGYSYLTGTSRSFLGIPVSGGGYGAELLDGIVGKYPYLPFSDDALFHLAGYYFQRGRYVEAELIYEKLIRNYPQSEWAGLAEYQIGKSAMLRLKGVEYDLAPLDKAERHFERYLAKFPGGDRVREAREGQQEIARLRAERLLYVARFYLREGKTRAARFYLQKIVRDYPRTPSVADARELLQEESK